MRRARAERAPLAVLGAALCWLVLSGCGGGDGGGKAASVAGTWVEVQQDGVPVDPEQARRMVLSGNGRFVMEWPGEIYDHGQLISYTGRDVGVWRVDGDKLVIHVTRIEDYYATQNVDITTEASYRLQDSRLTLDTGDSIIVWERE